MSQLQSAHKKKARLAAPGLLILELVGGRFELATFGPKSHGEMVGRAEVKTRSEPDYRTCGISLTPPKSGCGKLETQLPFLTIAGG